MKPPLHAPCRVDFAGNGLDIPAFAVDGAFVVNCAISPLVSLNNWPYKYGAGIGGSAADAILRGHKPAATGWQDFAIIQETGLCIWRSGPTPVLDTKVNPDWLKGLMALWYSGKPLNRIDVMALPRSYQCIAETTHKAADAVRGANLSKLAKAINMAHNQQLDEGMKSVPSALHSIGYKYVGYGHGGYVLYLFASVTDRNRFCEREDTMVIEPFLNRSSDAPQQ